MINPRLLIENQMRIANAAPITSMLIYWHILKPSCKKTTIFGQEESAVRQLVQLVAFDKLIELYYKLLQSSYSPDLDTCDFFIIPFEQKNLRWKKIFWRLTKNVLFRWYKGIGKSLDQVWIYFSLKGITTVKQPSYKWELDSSIEIWK